MKKQIISLFIFFFLIAGTLLVLAQDTGVTNSLNQNSQLTETTVNTAPTVLMQKVDKSTSKTTGEIYYFFHEADSALRIGKNDYWNIKPTTNEQRAVIITDANGSIVEADFVVNEKGGNYVLGNNKFYAPPNSKVSFYNGQLSLKVEDNSKFESMPSLVDPQKKGSEGEYIDISGKNIVLPNGNVLNDGRIQIKSGQALLYASSTFNNLKISESYYPYIPIFLDGEKHDGLNLKNYISMNVDSKKMHIFTNDETGSSFDLEFEKDNPFIKVTDNNYFKIKLNNKNEIDIKNPQKSIPKITGKISAVIEDGNLWIFATQDYLSVSPSSKRPDKNQAPILIETDNEKYSDKALFVSNYGTYKILPKNSPSISEYSTLDYNYGNTPEGFRKQIDEEIKKINPNVESLNLLDINTLDVVKDVLKDTPTNYFSGQKIIVLPADEFTREHGSGVTSAAGFVKFGEFDVYLSQEYITGNEKDLIRHEMVHSYHNTLLKQETDTADITSELKQKINDVIKGSGLSGIIDANPDIQYNANTQSFNGRLFEWKISSESEEITDLQRAKIDSIDQQIIKIIPNYDGEFIKKNGENFQHEWMQAQPASTYPSFLIVAMNLDSNKWPDQTTNPKNGFIRPYGAKNIYDDVATFVQDIYSKPQTFKDNGLLDPKNPNYNPIYRQKLDLLYKYKFITEKEYSNVLNLAGVK